MENFSDFLKKYGNRKIALGIHRNADLDALSSAYALSSLFPNSQILTPDEMNSPAKNFANDFGIKVSEFSKVKKEQFEGIIILDSGSYALIKDAKSWKVLCYIDHHQKSEGEERISADLEIWDGSSPSTSQIVSSLMEKPNAKSAFALAVGIISDTARFKNGNAQTFSELARLLEISGKTYAEALKYAEPELQADEKINILEAFQKAEAHIYKNFVIATTVVNSNESNASSFLSEVADIAFCASWKLKEKTTRVSARARKHVPVALNRIMSKIGKEFGASGGGHAKAAGANAKEKPEIVLKRCVELAKDAFDEIDKIEVR